MDKVNLYTTIEAKSYLNVSNGKFKTLVSSEILVPADIIHTQNNRTAHLFSAQNLIKAKKYLEEQKYVYKYG